MTATLLLLKLVVSDAGCEVFPASLNGTVCSNMTRTKSGDASAQACRQACCDAGNDCNSWSWHSTAQHCSLSPEKLSPATDCRKSSPDAYTGESRGAPLPTPVPVPKKRWNLEPGLVPPSGMWRGATIDKRFPPQPGEGVIDAFQTAYGKRLHIYRTFKTQNYVTLTDEEKAFAEDGGILFYSIQPQNWTEWGDSNAAWKIKKFADEIKKIAPAQVLVAAGFEPDGHAAESQNNTKLVFGKAAEYKKMVRNFRKVFDQENVTNALFLLDFSCNLRNWPFVLPELYPGDDVVDWAFFNLFQSQPQAKTGPKTGNCSTMANELYAVFENGVISSDKPWGVGAWGTMNATFGAPPKYPSHAIPTEDRKLCIEQMMDVFQDRVKFPKLQAAIYFDSLNSMISPYANASYGSPELAPTLQKMLDLDVFAGND